MAQHIPKPLVHRDTYHSNSSEYTLDTVNVDHDLSYAPTTPLLTTQSTSPYGAAHSLGAPPNSRKLIFNAILKMSTIFIISTVLLGSVLWVALPTLDE